MAGERCPSCGMPIFGDGPCLHSTTPVIGYRGPVGADSTSHAPKTPINTSGDIRARVAVNLLTAGLGAYWLATAIRQFCGAVGYEPAEG